MYITGVGGTGKLHVINTVVNLFEHIGKRDKLLVAAPTGIAATLINGHTIHTLTYLPNPRCRIKTRDLQRIWCNVKYLIIDEISMVSAQFLMQICQCLNQAKQCLDSTTQVKLFGGINVIFTGDLSQLKPVQVKAMFSHQLRENRQIVIVQSDQGQSEMFGAFLWMQVNCVVELQKNMRQRGDDSWAALLARIWLGEAVHHDTAYTLVNEEQRTIIKDDYVTLMN
jgi:ATP-dependent DNA helicase PIF1